MPQPTHLTPGQIMTWLAPNASFTFSHVIAHEDHLFTLLQQLCPPDAFPCLYYRETTEGEGILIPERLGNTLYGTLDQG